MQSAAQIQQAFVSAVLDDRELNELLKNSNCSVDELATLLQGVEESSNVLQQQLFRTIRDNLETFISSYTQHHELHNQLIAIASACASTMDKIADDSAVTDALQQYNDASIRASTNRQEIEALRTVQALVEKADTVEQHLDGSALVEATNSLLAFEAALQQLEADGPHGLDWTTLDVFDLLQERKTKLHSRLVSVLESSMADALQCDEAPKPRLRIMHRPTSLFICFQLLDILPAQLSSVKRRIYKHLVTPFFDNCTKARFSVDDDELTLTTQAEDGLDTCDMMIQLDTLLEFLSTRLLDTDKEIRHLFGNLMLPEMFRMIIDKGLYPAVPASAAELGEFDRVTEHATRFEQQCLLNGFLTSDQLPGALQQYTQNIDTHFATKRSEKVLLEGRRVMLRRLYDVEDLGGPGKEHFQITQTPKLLSLLLADVMKEANGLTASHPVSARKLHDAVFDLLDLFRAIMPCYHRNHYLSHPAAALVFRNDCFWLANDLRTNFRDKMFDNAGSRLESLGKSWYEVVLAQRIQVLHAILDKTEGFAMIAENRQRQQECEEAVERAVYQVMQIAPAVRGAIDESLYMRLLSSIVDSVLARLIGDIEHIRDIGAEDSHLIAVSLNSVLKLVDVFDGYEGQPASEPLVASLVPSWRKFWLLKDLLEMGLRDIMAKFQRGELFMFEKSELVGLICALFSDTDLRASIIREIQTPGSGTEPVFGTITQHDTTIQESHDNAQQRQQQKTASSSRPMTWAPEDEDDVDMSGWDDPGDDMHAVIDQPSSRSRTGLSIHPDDDNVDLSGWDDPEEITTSSLSIQPEDDHMDMSAWDDPKEEMSSTQQQQEQHSMSAPSISLVHGDDDDMDMSGWDDHEIPTGHKSPKKTVLSSVEPKDEENDMSGWDDPEDKIEIPHHDVQPQTKPVQSKTPISMLPKDTEDDDWSGWDDS